MNKAIHKFCINSAGLLVGVYFWAILIGHMFPLFGQMFKPTDSAEKVAHYYAVHHTQLQIGYTLGAFASVLTVLYTCAIVWEVQKMTGGIRTIAANIQLAFGVLFCAIGFFPFCILLTATMRTDRSPQLVQLLNDLGMNFYEAPQAVAVVHLTLLGILMLMDRQAIPTFPKWMAYLSFLVAFADGLGSFVAFQLNGPWAWNGVISAWIIGGLWGIWLNGMMFYMNKSVEREYTVPESVLFATLVEGTDEMHPEKGAKKVAEPATT